MSHEDIKAAFADAVSHVVSNISQYTASPGRDFTRSRKMRADRLISFLVSCGSSGTRIELLDFFGLQAGSSSASAFNQQRAKLRPEALEAVFHRFNSALQAGAGPGFRFVAADGSTFTFFSRPSFASPEYFVSEGHSAKGFYSMHLNALYDLQKHTYPAALIQPVHYKDEFRAFCDMVHRVPGMSSSATAGTALIIRWPMSWKRDNMILPILVYTFFSRMFDLCYLL